MAKLFAFALLLSSTCVAQAVDYADSASWLCRPGREDACKVDLNASVVSANGTIRSESWTAAQNAPVDCFYVYPTVSTDRTPLSDMIADPAERNVIRQQFARFGSKCRTFAPMYRQVTLAGLRQLMGGGGGSLDHGVQYDDVLAAWRYYLEHDNRGRGFLLIGHSQGSYILTRLIREEIDGKPIAAQLVSAILAGATVPVPRGKDVGGAFQHIPVCRASSQTGCVVSFVSFRSTAPPPENTRFGKVADPAMMAICTNPAALGGGSAALDACLSNDGSTIVGTTPPKPWVTPEQSIASAWVKAPGLLTAECKTNEYATYLEITVHGDPADPRTDDITGDLRSGAQIQADWGLHLIDMNLTMGNLVDLAGQQSRAWLAAKSGR